MDNKTSLLLVSSTPVAYSIYERMNISLWPLDHRFVLIRHPLKAIFRSVTSPRTLAWILLRWSKHPTARVRSASLELDYEFTEAEPIDPGLLAGWESDIPRETVFVRREKWLFDWLLEKFPFPEFRLVVLKSNKQQIGYVLVHFRKRANALVEGKIVDLFARGWDHGHLTALFREGVRVLSNLGVHVISYHATHPAFIALAKENGFTMTRTQRVAAYGAVAEAISSGATSLHMTFYDQDEAYY
jgi:hypothetical protein